MPDRSFFDLPHLLAALKRSWPLILALILVTGYAAYVVSWLQPESYQATAKLLFRPTDPPPQIDPNAPPPENPASAESISATNLELAAAAADRSAARVAQRLDSGLDAAELRDSLSFNPEGQTEFISVSATADSAREAATIANAFSEEIVQERRREAQQKVQRVIDAIQASLATPGLASDSAQQLRARSQQLQTEKRLQTGDVELGVAAVAPSKPSAPKPMNAAIIGGILGALLGGVLALIIARIDRRLDDDEVEEVVGAEIVARIPVETGNQLDRQLFLESFQFLRANLQLRFELRPWDERVIAVTSPTPSSGKTTVVLGLAQALASSGYRVAVVDFDLRRPALHSRLGGKVSPGVADAIIGKRPAKALLQETNDPGIRLLPAGSLRPERASAAVVGVEQVAQFYDEMRKLADYVLVDTGPVMVGADSTVIATAVDGLLMVVDAAGVEHNVLAAATEQLRAARAPVLGVVLNRTDPVLQRDEYARYSSEATAPKPSWPPRTRKTSPKPPGGTNGGTPELPPARLE
jgi:polysaccharide biosynthesis transport protein